VGLGSEGRLLERDLEVVTEVGATAGTGASPPSEDVAEAEEVPEDVAEVGEDRRVEAGGGATQPRVSVGVVAPALVGIAEGAIGLGRFLESLLGLVVPGFRSGWCLRASLR